MDVSRNKTGKRVQHKIIFLFLACCMALTLAYAISKLTFDEMLKTVDNISTPNEKLKLVGKISRDILQLDQLQRYQLLFLDSPSSFQTIETNYTNGSEEVIISLDSLKILYANSQIQRQRIDSISELLKERDKLFLSYAQVRNRLMDNSTFNNQLQNITNLIKNNPSSKLVTTQRTLKTTITNNIGLSDNQQEKKEKSFFGRLFGSNKKEEENNPLNIPDKTVHEELSIHVDTLDKSEKANSTLDQAISTLKSNQLQQSSIFIDREAELTIAGNILVNNMMNILYDVELEAKNQMEEDVRNAQIKVNNSVMKISYILLGSLLITSILIYFVFNDIKKANSYRKALEKSKEEAEYHSAAKQRFLSNMSHELRTPLQSIIGYTEQLKLSSVKNEKYEIIYNASEHLLHIVNEVLDYNRIVSGKFILNQKTTHLEKTINDVITSMRQQANLKNLSLNLEKHVVGSGYVLADPFRLKQILFNLISNAIKFTNEGYISVSLQAVEVGEITKVELSVSDTGIGINEKDKRLIFNEFEQGPFHGSGETFGSGLGLSIVKALVRTMGGEIKVKSTINEGSRFIISLTFLSSNKADLVHEKIKNRKIEHVDVTKVWVVDDDSFILDLCNTILENKKIPHKVFASPEAILDELIDPDLSHILIDMRMPGISGIELLNLLRRKTNKNVKIVAFTAQALPEERIKILSAGFDGLLIKPFREAELLGVLNIIEEKTESYVEDTSLGILPMVYEDPKELSSIINIFIKDTLDDLMNLKSAIKKQNAVNAEILFHRLAGRSAQLGQEKIAFNLRKCEIDTRNGELSHIQEVDKIETQLLNFIEFLIEKEKTIT